MYKNIDNQKIAVFAWDDINSTPKTGDSANITAQISLDGGSSATTNDANPTELDSTNHPGIYLFDMTQAETNADFVVLTAASSTTGIVFRPMLVYTTTLTTTKAGYLDASIASLNDITVADIISGIADGSYDLQEMLRIMFAALAGKSSGGGTSAISFRDSADTKDRISATVDIDGNRIAITVDGS